MRFETGPQSPALVSHTVQHVSVFPESDQALPKIHFHSYLIVSKKHKIKHKR